MIRRDHHLLGVQPQLRGHLFHRVNRSPVDVSLAGFAQTPVAQPHAEAFEQAFERGRAAIHRRSLHDFGNEEAAFAEESVHNSLVSNFCDSIFPTPRIANSAGETRSISISTLPGNPCCEGINGADSGLTASSTRTRPERGSLATRLTVALTWPYSVHAKPSNRRRARWPA